MLAVYIPVIRVLVTGNMERFGIGSVDKIIGRLAGFSCF